MKALTRWDPFADVTHARRMMDRIFDDTFFRPYRLGFWRVDGGYVPLDIYQTEDDVVVKASLPGLRPEDVDLSIEGNTLTIRSEVETSKEEEKNDYVLRERRSGSFHRTVTLPRNLQTDKAKADFEDGVLTVSIPKAEEAKPRTIKVNTTPTIKGKKA